MKSSGDPDRREQHAVVVAAVQVERRLGRREQRGGLLVRQLGHLQCGVVQGAVVADGGHDALGSPMDSFTLATSQVPS